MERKINIPINKLCLDYRDDILLRVFVLEKNRLDIWEKFCSLPVNKKVRRYKYKVVSMKSIIKLQGQMVPVKVVNVAGILYPAMGATRIAAMLSLDIRFIDVIICKIAEVPKWNKDFTLRSKFFVGMPEKMITDFKDWKERYYEKVNQKIVKV